MNHKNGCTFCAIVTGNSPSFRLWEDDETLAFMDIMPQSPGHALIIPKTHGETIFDISEREALATMRTTKRVAHAVRSALEPDGVMIAQLNGKEAGQTVFHVHFHVIPRYTGVKMKLHARVLGKRPELDEIRGKIAAALD